MNYVLIIFLIIIILIFYLLLSNKSSENFSNEAPYDVYFNLNKQKENYLFNAEFERKKCIKEGGNVDKCNKEHADKVVLINNYYQERLRDFYYDYPNFYYHLRYPDNDRYYLARYPRFYHTRSSRGSRRSKSRPRRSSRTKGTRGSRGSRGSRRSRR